MTGPASEEDMGVANVDGFLGEPKKEATLETIAADAKEKVLQKDNADVTDEDLKETDPEADRKPEGAEDAPEEVEKTDPPEEENPEKPGAPEELEPTEPVTFGPADDLVREFKEIPESISTHFGVKDSVILSDGETFRVATDNGADEDPSIAYIDLDVVTLLRIALNKLRKTGNLIAISKVNEALSRICAGMQ